MNDFKNGMLVQHSSLGLGKVIAFEQDAVHVFFETSERRFATKLRLPLAGPMLSPAMTKSSWLKGLSSFALDPKTGRYGLAQTWLTQDQAVARFTEVFPGGFADPKYLAAGKEKSDRAAKWRAAHETYSKALGDGEGERLLADGGVDELIRRVARVEHCITVLHPTSDRTALRETLCNPTASHDYFVALFELLAAPSPDKATFEKLTAAVAAMPLSGSPGFNWQVATLLLFIAQPDRHMLLQPKTTCDAANRLGFSLSYEATPNWKTYSALLRSSDLLLAALKPLGARDHIDVECFMHVIASKRVSA
jgi:hypothetical protein